jgi:hypothetical protein
LCYKESHTLQSALTLPIFLGNQDLDDTCSDCQILLSADAQLSFEPTMSHFTLRGLTLQGTAPHSTNSVIVVDNSSEQMQQLNIEDCLFQDNHGSHSWQGGGSCLFAYEPGHGLAINILRCVFRLNSSEGYGGVMFVGSDYDLTLEDSEFTDNANDPSDPPSTYYGGCIAVVSPDAATDVVMRRCTFQHNESQGPGGAIAIDDGNLTLESCDISYSESGLTGWPAGAGVFVRRNVIQEFSVPLNVNISDCTFRGNTGHPISPEYAGDGGGVLVKGYSQFALYSVHVTDTLFEENFNAQGAGIYIGRYATALIERTRFLNNTANLDGGASYKGGKYWFSLGETARYEYCEFVGNRCGIDINGNPSEILGRGGAFSTRLYPRAEFVNCTFLDNVAGGPMHLGDAIYHFAEYMTFDVPEQRCDLINCVFYGTGGNDVQIHSDPNGFNIVSNCAYEDGEYICEGVTPIATVYLTESPFISPDDRRLHDNSPCIDHGTDVGIPVDLVGTTVPQGLETDIGAYEFIDDLSGIAADAPGPGLFPLAAYPNPFNPLTTIKFELAQPRSLRLSIHDLAGRQLAVLAEGHFPGGTHAVTWSGLDAGGRSAGSGVYVARLDAGGQSRTLKLILVR